MPYKSIFLIVFSLLFFASPSFAAIPIPQAKTDTVSKQERKVLKKLQQKIAEKVKDKNPNINGLLSFIFGIGGLWLPPFAVPAIILGIISLNKKEPRMWMPIVGIVLGSLMMLAIIALLVFFLIVFA